MKRISSQGRALAGMARPKLLTPGIRGGGGSPDPGEAGRRAWGWGRLLPGPAGTQRCCLISIFPASPLGGGCLPTEYLCQGALPGDIFLLSSSGFGAEEALEMSSLSLEVPSLKERGPENQTDSFSPHPTPPGHQPPIHWAPAKSPTLPPPHPLQNSWLHSWPYFFKKSRSQSFSLGAGEKGQGRMVTFSLPWATTALGGTSTPCLVCKCRTKYIGLHWKPINLKCRYQDIF